MFPWRCPLAPGVWGVAVTAGDFRGEAGEAGPGFEEKLEDGAAPELELGLELLEGNLVGWQQGDGGGFCGWRAVSGARREHVYLYESCHAANFGAKGRVWQGI